MKLTQLFTVLTAGALALVSVSAIAAPQPMDATQKAQIESVVHDYLMKNPQVIVDAVNSMQKEQYEKMQEKTQQSALVNVSNLFHLGTDPVVGNPKGKITIVEFFDYQCPHCVDMAPVIDGIIKSNPDVRIVLKDFPIRGPMSVTAAKASLAANMQGKYWEFYQVVMKNAAGLTEDKLYGYAKGVGLNVDKLKADMNSPAVDAQIKGTYKLAQDLQLMGTPALFIAKTDLPKDANVNAIAFVPGQIDQKNLQGMLDKTAHS